MNALFQIDPDAEKAEKTRAASLEPEACPVCGRRFESGRLMAAHASEDRQFVGRATGTVLVIKSAVICHGFQ